MKIKNLKYTILALGCGVVFSMTSCKDWLEIYPENSQPSGTYWQTKEEVEAVVNAGYYYVSHFLKEVKTLSGGTAESFLSPTLPQEGLLTYIEK